jgi:hypothetical protein
MRRSVPNVHLNPIWHKSFFPFFWGQLEEDGIRRFEWGASRALYFEAQIKSTLLPHLAQNMPWSLTFKSDSDVGLVNSR